MRKWSVTKSASNTLCKGFQTNILVGDDGRAVICDFGLSVLNTPSFSEVDNAADSDASTTSSSSRTSVASGRYAASELLKDDDITPTCASDVWGFGCVALRLIYNETPYSTHRRDDLATFAAHQGECPADLLIGGSVSGKYTASDPMLLSRSPMTDYQMRQLIHDCWDCQSERRSTMQFICNLLAPDRCDHIYWAIVRGYCSFCMAPLLTLFKG